MNKNLFILAVVFAAAPAEVAAIDTPAAPSEAAEMYTFNPAAELTALSLAGYKIEKFEIKKA